MISARTLQLASLYQIAVVLSAGLLSILFWDGAASGIFLGGLLMGANFWARRYLASKVFEPERAKPVYLIALGMKMMVALGLIALLLKIFSPHPVGFAIGMATLFMGIGLAITHQALRPMASAST
jgi:hypothetical protein